MQLHEVVVAAGGLTGSVAMLIMGVAVELTGFGLPLTRCGAALAARGIARRARPAEMMLNLMLGMTDS